MPVNKNGRYIPTDETDEIVQQIIENHQEFIWEAEQDPDEPDYWILTEEIGVLDTVGLYDEHIDQRAQKIVDRHNKAVRRAIRATLESMQPILSSTQTEPSEKGNGNGAGEKNKDWLDNRPIVLVDLRVLAEVGEVNYMALREEDRIEYDRITEVFRRGYVWSRDIEQNGKQFGIFVHPIVVQSMGLPG